MSTYSLVLEYLMIKYLKFKSNYNSPKKNLIIINKNVIFSRAGYKYFFYHLIESCVIRIKYLRVLYVVT